jgi:hypothetical protein
MGGYADSVSPIGTMNQITIIPVGVALYTRGSQHGEDYAWYLQMENLRLFNTMEELHRLALRDIHGEVPSLAVLVTLERIGLVVAKMPSPRQDHVSRLVANTLYLEFDKQDQAKVLTTVATLLASSREEYEQHQQHFTDYADELYRLGQHFLKNSPLAVKDLVGVKLMIGENLTHFNAVLEMTGLYQTYLNFLQQGMTLPIKEDLEDKDSLPLVPHDKRALPYQESSVKDCVNLLLNLAKQPEVNSWCLVSTGRMGLEKCYQVAEKFDQCLILTQSSEVSEEFELGRGNLLEPLTKTLTQAKKKVVEFWKNR